MPVIERRQWRDLASLDRMFISPREKAAPAVVIANPRVASPQQARTSGKPVVFLFGNIHPPESEAAETLHMVMRDLTAGRRSHLLDHQIVVITPLPCYALRVLVTRAAAPRGPYSPGGMMSIEETRQVLESYWREHDSRYVAEDAVFTMMPTGQEIHGREAIGRHLQGFYHGALEARAEIVHALFADGEGVLEARVVGRHTGEFAGVAGTGRAVDVPLCVVYQVAGGRITRARIYLQVNVLMAQITAA
jgi:limonene-1,2-epoxide hydrolase